MLYFKNTVLLIYAKWQFKTFQQQIHFSKKHLEIIMKLHYQVSSKNQLAVIGGSEFGVPSISMLS